MEEKAYNIDTIEIGEKIKNIHIEDKDEPVIQEEIILPVIPDEVVNSTFEISDLDNIKKKIKKKWFFRFIKRSFDIVSSFLGIIVFALPMIIVAIAVKCSSKGPAIFKTERVGKNDKPFKFYKFRSMRIDAPKDCAPMLLDSDSYITKVGAFIRKTSLDELPQLFCILKGDMSVIGPRPAGLSEQELNELRTQKGVTLIRPGLTGWAQINGRDVTASHIDVKVKYDAEYLEKMSLWLDIKIFFKTIGKVFKHDGVVEGKHVVEEKVKANK